ncbi:unnamed protein product [Linum trigynum]|uniref:Uncharacterized protein n=1 Tax=Linum trigynum TaxID=586398 RepID=A0AAV2GN40_9ROSI
MVGLIMTRSEKKRGTEILCPSPKKTSSTMRIAQLPRSSLTSVETRSAKPDLPPSLLKNSSSEIELGSAAELGSSTGRQKGWSPPGKESEKKVEGGGTALFPFEPMHFLSFDKTLLTFCEPMSGLGCVLLGRPMVQVVEPSESRRVC